ncbi:hypothetical protein D3C87_1464760 [compost metagenome]
MVRRSDRAGEGLRRGAGEGRRAEVDQVAVGQGGREAAQVHRRRREGVVEGQAVAGLEVQAFDIDLGQVQVADVDVLQGPDRGAAAEALDASAEGRVRVERRGVLVAAIDRNLATIGADAVLDRDVIVVGRNRQTRPPVVPARVEQQSDGEGLGRFRRQVRVAGVEARHALELGLGQGEAAVARHTSGDR